MTENNTTTLQALLQFALPLGTSLVAGLPDISINWSVTVRAQPPAFPDVYATAFSAFYLPFMLLLVMLIFRAVAIEFRSKEAWPWWRTLWDTGFFMSSLAVGEESASMPEVLRHLAEQYHDEAGRRLAALAAIAGYGIWLMVGLFMVIANTPVVAQGCQS